MEVLMAQIFKKCPSCSGLITIYTGSKKTICPNCQIEHKTESLLDKNDKQFFASFDDKNLELSLKYNAFIVQGNEHISNAQFSEAEKCFKQAITLDENRYEGYYGVARAKTQDFQFLPDENDYLEYAKLAINMADDDIDPKINANLAKLNIIKNKN